LALVRTARAGAAKDLAEREQIEPAAAPSDGVR